MRTVGVEEELLLVDAHTGLPRSVASQVLRLAEERGEAGAESGGGSLGHEVQQEQLEADTRPHTDLAELEADLRTWRTRAATSAREAGARVLACGTSPLPAEPRMVQTERFAAMAERFGLTMAEQLTCGCHVHVSVESDDEAIAVLDRIRVWLPVLLALSANSPYWQGADSGYASFRQQVISRWPTSGPPEIHGTAAAYRTHVDALLEAGVGLDEGMLYADARPSRSYPTLEFRAADVCADVRDTVLVAALARALVESAAEDWKAGEPAPTTPTALLRLATWQAAREGVSGQLLHPLTGRLVPAREVTSALLDQVGPALRTTDEEDLVADRVDHLLAEGSGADRQRAVMEKTGDLLDVVAAVARTTAGHEE